MHPPLPWLLLALAPARAEPGGFLLKVRDQHGLLGGPTEVHVVSAEGPQARALLRDDGQLPDATAGDGVWSAPVASVGGSPVEVSIQVGDELRAVEAPIEDRPSGPVLFLVLGRRGLAVAVEQTGQEQANARPTAASGDAATLSGEPWDGRIGAAWALLSNALALLAGALGAWRLRGRVAVPVPPPAPAAIPPLRVGVEWLDRALAGPLSARRILFLGELASPPPGAQPCLEPELLPVELAHAARAVAATPGRPVAILVADPTRLDPEQPMAALEQLDRVLGGALELWAVDGPPAWESWRGEV